jgi:hypothetical protein
MQIAESEFESMALNSTNLYFEKAHNLIPTSLDAPLLRAPPIERGIYSAVNLDGIMILELNGNLRPSPNFLNQL